MRRVILSLLGLIGLSLLVFYAAVIDAPRIERSVQAEAVQRLNNAGIAGVSVRADGRRLMATGDVDVQSTALQLMRQQFGVQEANWVDTSLGSKASVSTGIYVAVVEDDTSATPASPTNADSASNTDGGTSDTVAPASAIDSIDSTAGAWATGLRLDDTGLSLSGDSIDDDLLMQSTVEQLRVLAGNVPVNVTAKAQEALPDSWSGGVIAGATALAEMGAGNALLSNGQLKITGTVVDREREESIRRALVQLTPSTLSWRTEFSYVNDGSPVEGLSAFECNTNLFGFMDGKKIVFERASTSLSFESFEVLDGVVDVLTECPSVRVEVAGFTDARGSLQLNNDISQGRADTVRLYMIERGIAATRVMATGYGPQRPIATNETAEGRALNRRIEFNVFGE